MKRTAISRVTPQPLAGATDAKLFNLADGLAAASMAENTKASYRSALAGFGRWLAGRPVTDAALAGYLEHLHEAGRSAATAAMIVAAVRAVAKAHGSASPVGKRSKDALAGFRRSAAGRGRGQARPVSAEEVAAIIAVAGQPRFNRDRSRRESLELAEARGLEDAAIAALLFQAALRRSELAALRWSDITPASVAGALLVRIRRSKTDQDGEGQVRFIKNGCAAAVERLRASRPDAEIEADAPVIRGAKPGTALSPQAINRRFKAAAKAAGIEGVTAHSGRVGLASEGVRLGGSTADVMLAGGWKTARMVAHYARGATAERGLVARYL